MLSRRPHGSRPDGAVPRSRRTGSRPLGSSPCPRDRRNPRRRRRSSSWRRRLRRLQSELGDFAVRNLINLGAVVAVCLLIAADAPTVRALGALAGLAVPDRRSWSAAGRTSTPSRRRACSATSSASGCCWWSRSVAVYLHSRPDAGPVEVAAAWVAHRDLVAAGDGRALGQDPAGHHQDRGPQPARGSAGAEGAVLTRAGSPPATCWPSSSRPLLAALGAAGLAAAGAGPGHRAADPAHRPPRAAGDRGEQADRAGHPGRAAGVRAGLRRLLRRRCRAPGISWACGCRTWSGWTSPTW